MKIVTCIAPVNIAVIKYWGKRDEQLILPINDSISGTLSTDHMHAKTTVMASPIFEENKFWLNGKEEAFDGERLNNCLEEVKRRASSDLGDLLKWNLHICSENNFPTAAGLASSAAGYACLVYALANLYGLRGDISSIARRGSGSACRSVYGGWVHWHKGLLPDGTDSIATQIVPASHWPDMRVLVLVVNDQQKKCSSTAGMRRGVATSDFLKHRAEVVVPKRIEAMTKVIRDRNFEVFAEITMRDSNQFHAVCLDTFPPCVYLNQVSYVVMDLVHDYNKLRGSNKVAYTFDAGPNACLYLLEEDVSEVVTLINYIFPPPPQIMGVEYMRGSPLNVGPLDENIPKSLSVKQQPSGCLKYIIHTNVGDGPKILTSDHLLTNDGSPKNTSISQ